VAKNIAPKAHILRQKKKKRSYAKRDETPRKKASRFKKLKRRKTKGGDREQKRGQRRENDYSLFGMESKRELDLKHPQSQRNQEKETARRKKPGGLEGTRDAPWPSTPKRKTYNGRTN